VTCDHWIPNVMFLSDSEIQLFGVLCVTLSVRYCSALYHYSVNQTLRLQLTSTLPLHIGGGLNRRDVTRSMRTLSGLCQILIKNSVPFLNNNYVDQVSSVLLTISC